LKICILGDARSVHLQRLAPSLAQRGHEIHILCHKPVAIRGVTVERFHIPGPGLTNLRGWRGRYTSYLKSLLRDFDIVNIQFLAGWGLTPEIMRHGCIVASPWGSDIVPPPGEGQPSPELTGSRVSVLRHADLVTTWGPTFAGIVARFAGIETDCIRLAPLGVDTQLFDPKKYAEGRTPGVRRVGFFKGFREVYGATYLVRAIPIILNRLPDTQFDLLGDGPQKAECWELATSLEVNSAVNWMPSQPYDRIPRWLAMWDVTAIPSLCESFGAAALEASAMCVPVVASHVGGLPDTVRDGTTGLLVPPGSPQALAGAVVSLLKDAERRARMGRDGRELVEREYEWSDSVDQWENVLMEARDRAVVMV